jgi:membrane-associated phospholipid phosphatase
VGIREGRRREMSALVGKTSVAVWIALVAAGSALAFVARGTGPLPGDLLLTRSLQGASFGGLADSLLIRAGEVVWFLPPLAVLVAIIGRWWWVAFFISLASATGVLIPDAIKLLVARPRPAEDLVWVLGPQENYGFPSGTAFLSVVLLGAICYLLWRARPRRPVAAVTLGISLLLILSSGLSRVYVGEHWATDVLGGWLLGGAWLMVLVVVHRWWTNGIEGQEA